MVAEQPLTEPPPPPADTLMEVPGIAQCMARFFWYHHMPEYRYRMGSRFRPDSRSFEEAPKQTVLVHRVETPPPKPIVVQVKYVDTPTHAPIYCGDLAALRRAELCRELSKILVRFQNSQGLEADLIELARLRDKLATR